MINVGIVFGGKSVEHDISIITFYQVYYAINKEKYKIIPIYLDRNNDFYYFRKIVNINTFSTNKIDKYLRKRNFIKDDNKTYFGKDRIDVCIICVHGKDLENGVISGFFKLLGVPVTIPDIYESACFHNKFLTKLLLKENMINTLDYKYVTKRNKERIINEISNYNVICKPVSLGSSIGVKVVSSKEELEKALDDAFRYDEGVIIEDVLDSFIELNQAFYIQKNEVILSKIEEVKVNDNFYSFDMKYRSKDVKRVIPARVSNSLKSKICKTTIKIASIFNSIGVVRIDYMYSKTNNILYVNEINVIPGALSYYLFEAKNIYFDKLIDDLIKEAVHKKMRESSMISSFSSNVLSSSSNKK